MVSRRQGGLMNICDGTIHQINGLVRVNFAIINQLGVFICEECTVITFVIEKLRLVVWQWKFLYLKLCWIKHFHQRRKYLLLFEVAYYLFVIITYYTHALALLLLL